MASGQFSKFLQHIRRLVGTEPAATASDRRLLERYVQEQDESAFRALVERHGPLVLRVCRSVLPDAQEAEDAFQASFLVLSRKAASIRWNESMGAWLYEVAQRTALKARGKSARRRAHERQVGDMHDSNGTNWFENALHAAKGDGAATVDASDDDRQQMFAVLNEELRQLPSKYRDPLVLCFLQGKTHEEAAIELGWARGSMAHRLKRAQDLLRNRLSNRGVALSAALLSTALPAAASAAVPPALVEAAVRISMLHAAGQLAAISANVLQLADAVVRGMLYQKLRFASAMLLALGLLGVGTGILLHHTLGEARADDPEPVAFDTVQPLLRLRIHDEEPCTAVAFAPKGDLLATGCHDGTLQLWELPSGKELKKLQEKKAGEATCISFSPDGTLLAAASEDHSVRIWNVRAGELLHTLEGHDGSVTSVAFSPNGTLIASSGDDSTIRLWNVVKGKQVRKLSQHEGPVNSIAFSRDGSTLVSGSDDETVAVWQVDSGKRLHSLEGHDHNVHVVAYSPVAAVCASGCEHGSVRVWDADQGKALRTLELGRAVKALAFSAHGRWLAAADEDGKVRLWEVATGTELCTFAGHEDGVASLAFSPDSRTLVTGSQDATAVVWQLPLRGRFADVAAADLTNEHLDRLWADLADGSPLSRQQAVTTLTAAPDKAVSLLQTRLAPSQEKPEQIARWIADLDHDRFRTREAAFQSLEKIGEDALPALRQAREKDPSPEVRKRTGILIERAGNAEAPTALRQVRAVQVLEQIDSSDARELLKGLAQDERRSVSREARQALTRLPRGGS